MKTLPIVAGLALALASAPGYAQTKPDVDCAGRLAQPAQSVTGNGGDLKSAANTPQKAGEGGDQDSGYYQRIQKAGAVGGPNIAANAPQKAGEGGDQGNGYYERLQQEGFGATQNNVVNKPQKAAAVTPCKG